MKKSFSSRTILIIVILVIIIIAAGIWCFEKQKTSTPLPISHSQTSKSLSTSTDVTLNQSQPSTTPTRLPLPNINTTGWQTYQNNQYNINFKYPSGWLVAPAATSTIKLTKNGYTLTIEACDCQIVQTTYSQNDLLFPHSVSLNVGGYQAWRENTPTFEGEDSINLEFSFTFLTNAYPAWNQPAFNDRSKFTPTGSQLQIGDMAYMIWYELPDIVTSPESNYDSSIVKQMDTIVQTINFTEK